MKCKKKFASVLFTCAAASLGIAQASTSTPIPPPPTADFKSQTGTEVRHEQNTLNRTFSSTIHFDYADIDASESGSSGLPLLAANTSPGSDAASAPQSSDAAAADENAVDDSGYTDAEVAEMINNPLGKLWLFMIQNDYISYDGDLVNNRIGQNTTLIQPVMPFQLTDNWKVIFRPVIPINSFETVESVDINFPNGRDPTFDNVDLNRETGLGDIVLWTAFATNEMAKPPNIFGFGVTTMLDTAAERELGTGQNSMGPMALAFHIDDKWIYGTVVQHWWNISDKDRADINLTDIQYIGRYRYSKDTNIGFSPNIRYNWEAKAGNRWTIPVGIGADTMIKIGPVPVKVGMEVYKYVAQPDKYGPDWQIRLFFVPVLPSPAWSQKALF